MSKAQILLFYDNFADIVPRMRVSTNEVCSIIHNFKDLYTNLGGKVEKKL